MHFAAGALPLLHVIAVTAVHFVMLAESQRHIAKAAVKREPRNTVAAVTPAVMPAAAHVVKGQGMSVVVQWIACLSSLLCAQCVEFVNVFPLLSHQLNVPDCALL